MPEACTVEEHLARVLADAAPLPAAEVSLLDALGLVCAEDVVSTLALPPFDNSAMDGYAVRYADIAGATESEPVRLPVVGEIGAGQSRGQRVEAGSAAKIMTGGRIPEGADVVVPYEGTDRGATTVRIHEVPEPGQHVRPTGDDVAEGELLVPAGTPLTSRHLGLLAAVGRASVLVHPRPRVAIISTGSELRDPGQELGLDSIYDGNSYLLAAACQRIGAVPVRVGIVPDDPPAFLGTLDELTGRADVIITSGGVSQGDYDVVKEALRPKGVWFGPVAMQPAKPQGFGRVGADQVPIVTLPGNPVSSYLSFEVFVQPLLRALMGRTPYSRPAVAARLTEPLRSPAGRRQFRRGVSGVDEQGRYAGPVGGPGSHLVGDLARADCLIVVPEDVTALDAGAPVELLMLDEEY